MTPDEVQDVLYLVRHKYNQAYDAFDRTLRTLGLDDDQILAAVRAVQPMLQAREDGVLPGAYLMHLEFERDETRPDPVGFEESVKRSIDEIRMRLRRG